MKPRQTIENYHNSNATFQRHNNLAPPSAAALVAGAVSNIMDSISAMDNMFYEGAILPVTNHIDNQAMSQQSLIKHQQLQKLLKATTAGNSQTKSSTSFTSAPHRADQNQRNSINSSGNIMNSMAVNMTHQQPPQPNLSSFPKSLLNLAACTSTSPLSSRVDKSSLTSSMNKFSSMVSQLTNSAKNLRATTSGMSGSSSSNNSKPFMRNSANITNHESSPKNLNDSSKILNHLPRVANVSGQSTRSGSKQLQMSLLSDDQTSQNGRSSSRIVGNVIPSGTSRMSSQILKQLTSSSREAYLAGLQERAAKLGVSIGEIGKSTPQNSLSNPASLIDRSIPITTCDTSQIQLNLTNQTFNQPNDEFVNTAGRKEIESALSQVEARNDLSLLYPPMVIASNSQRQLNSLSAGLNTPGEKGELFTDEVKKIVLEESNIIYECKECSNLFRSLANLVKHKRTYCTDSNKERNVDNIYARALATPLVPSNPSVSVKGSGDQTLFGQDTEACEEVEAQTSTAVNELKTGDESLTARSLRNPRFNLRASERRHNLTSDQLRMPHTIRNQENDLAKSKVPGSSKLSGASYQTSLSKLLQSQPKNRLPVIRDNALMGAINSIAPSSQILGVNSDKGCMIGSTTHAVHEQLVRNSSLAKTLLNEKVKGTNQGPMASSSSSILDGLKSMDLALPNQTEKAAPKRKLLEDCIRKVKRDKHMSNNGDEPTDIVDPSKVDDTAHESSTRETSSLLVGAKHDGVNDPVIPPTDETVSKANSSVSSEPPSDILMIDLDGHRDKSTEPQDGYTRHNDHTDSQSSASSATSMKGFEGSSALLKALTRPVEISSSNPSEKSLFEGQEMCEDYDQSETHSEEDRDIDAIEQVEGNNNAGTQLEDGDGAENDEDEEERDDDEDYDRIEGEGEVEGDDSYPRDQMNKILEEDDERLSFEDDDEQQEQIGMDNQDDYTNELEANHDDSQPSNEENSDPSEQSDEDESESAEAEIESLTAYNNLDESKAEKSRQSFHTSSESGPSNVSNQNAGGSSGSSSSGLMKLKITLKTRPDEKSKVYEIV